jgi:hypothetical protein
VVEKLTKLHVTAESLHGENGRVLYAVRNHRAVIDAPLAIGGPNESPTPVELLLAALTSEAIFLLQHIAWQEGIPICRITARSGAELNPLALVGEPVDPTFRRLSLRLEIAGPTTEQAEYLQQALRERSTILTTLEVALAMQLDVVALSP